MRVLLWAMALGQQKRKERERTVPPHSMVQQTLAQVWQSYTLDFELTADFETLSEMKGAGSLRLLQATRLMQSRE
jgi:hypothetical protein